MAYIWIFFKNILKLINIVFEFLKQKGALVPRITIHFPEDNPLHTRNNLGLCKTRVLKRSEADICSKLDLLLSNALLLTGLKAEVKGYDSL